LPEKALDTRFNPCYYFIRGKFIQRKCQRKKDEGAKPMKNLKKVLAVILSFVILVQIMPMGPGLFRKKRRSSA